MRVSSGESHLEGVTTIVQNGSPFTYFRERPIEVAEGASLQSGSLSCAVLHRATALDMPFLGWRAFSPRARLLRHDHVTGLNGITELRVQTGDGRALPLQVDGDYVGEVAEARYSILPAALTVVS
jgi:diacylglycerol kinase family enzyme